MGGGEYLAVELAVAELVALEAAEVGALVGGVVAAEAVAAALLAVDAAVLLVVARLLAAEAVLEGVRLEVPVLAQVQQLPQVVLQVQRVVLLSLLLVVPFIFLRDGLE